MRQLSIAALLMASSLFAATDEQIISYFKAQVPENITISVTERQKIEGHEGFDMVQASLSDGTQSQDITLFVKDGLMFPDIIELDSGVSMKQALEQSQIEKNLAKIYKQEDSKNIISLGNDSGKKTLVVFSDPECPYCRSELENVEKRLEEVNIKMILTPVHDKSSLEKSHLIYKETTSAKNDSEKIKILKKYFDENINIEEKVSEDAVSNMHKLRRKYLQGGLRGVPFMVEESVLLK
ncbi:MAG: thioredoxin fold domain-containing protein [Sulfurospirillaceae bacterium]|nr:thioredoxin fold domain-containing protein [Sulfurospirillaceae bacterium]MCK9546440.1 thioredoxin fold domain-containing protein [Sulfurospirillaceae bacterium]